MTPDFEVPGRVTLGHLGRFLDLSIGAAETYYDNHERKKILPKVKGRNFPRRCRRLGCSTVPALRCKACRTSYCSQTCQDLDWHRHVFVCTLRGRPNLADNFVLLLHALTNGRNTKDQIRQLRTNLLADKDVSKAFGFYGCETLEQVLYLIRVYAHIISSRRPGLLLQQWLDNGSIEYKLGRIIQSTGDCCLEGAQRLLSSRELLKEQIFGIAAHVRSGYLYAMQLLMPDGNTEADLNDAKRKAVWLYATLLEDFDNIPSRTQSQWIDFGFCFCADYEWASRMADAYLELAQKASLEEIADAWGKEYLLNDFYRAKGIDIVDFERAGIRFGRPEKHELGVYRLMLEVDRLHRGSLCKCCHFFGCCHRFPESFLSHESVMDYGFDTLSPWERWQMMALWQEIFASKKFNTREMLAARRSGDGETFQRYIEGIVDTRKYWNKYKAGMLFPNVRGFIDWRTSIMPLCYCICH